jgi:hypothetical protein
LDFIYRQSVRGNLCPKSLAFLKTLQADADAAYSKLVNYETDIPASNEINASELPAGAQKIYAATEENFKKLLIDWGKDAVGVPHLNIRVYKVEVDGQDTFAVLTPILDDSIREDFYVVDSKGKEIDSASVYSTAEVGENGVSWQHSTVQK